MQKLTPSIAVLMTTLLAQAASAHGLTSTSADYGSAAATRASRSILVTSSVKSINVTNGETVEFLVNGKSFSWRFDTLQTRSTFDLNKIAPEGVLAGNVRVYVAPNPLYRG